MLFLMNCSRFFVCAVILALSACTTAPTTSLGNGYAVIHSERNQDALGYATVEYKPQKMVVADAMAEADRKSVV